MGGIKIAILVALTTRGFHTILAIKSPEIANKPWLGLAMIPLKTRFRNKKVTEYFLPEWGFTVHHSTVHYRRIVLSKPIALRGWTCAFYLVPLAVIAAALLVLFPGRTPKVAATVSAGSSASLSPNLTPAAHRRIQDSYASLPLAFEQNQGQTDPQVKYLARGHGYTLFLTANDAVFSLHSRPVAERSKNQKDLSAVVHMHLLGANAQPTVAGTSATAGTANYFIGNDPGKWRTGVARYARVSYQNLYPGVNMAFHGSGHELEFDFVLAPGANPAPIGLQFSGNKGVKTDDSGDLIISSSAGNVLLHKPVAYQEQNGARQPVDARFVLKAANQVSFELGNYDRTRELVIDPSVSYAYSTYLGGSGDDNGIAIAFDSNGNAYVTGETASSNFPGANGGLRGLKNAFVAKLAADGSKLIYFTYVGGTQADSGNGIAVDASGDAVVAGGTQSPDLPASPGAFQSLPKPGNAGSAFLFKLSPDGTKLLYCTYLGGSVDDVAYGVALDSAGNAYLGGVTSSLDFPIPTNLVPLQSASGANDGFIAELNPGGNGASDLKFSTYLGPGGGTAAGVKAIALDSSNNIYVTGATLDATFHVTSGAYQSACGSCPNAFDAFVTVINPTTNTYVYSTFLGGAGADVGFGIAVDSAGDAYVTGSTTTATSTNGFPATAGARQTVYGTNTDAFVTKLNPTGTALLYSTYLGGTGADSASGIAVDKNFNAYVTGSTSSTDFPTVGPTQSSLAGGVDAFVSEINPANPAISQLVFSTYLGGTGTEDNLGLGGIAVDTNGAFIYVTGNTSSTNFPLTSAEQQTPGGRIDAFVVKYALAQSFAMSATTPAAVAPGTSATSTVSLTAYDGYSSPVNLTCTITGAGSPAPACSGASSFSPNPATPASPAATSTLTITTTANHAENFVPRKLFYALWMPIGGIALVGMGFTSKEQRRRKLMGLLMLGMILTTLLIMPACGGSSSGGGGGGGSGGTPAGAYTVTITGTGTDAAAITQTTQVTLTVN